MSYNIDTWKIHKLTLTLPRTFDFQVWLAMQPATTDNGRYPNYSKRHWTRDKDAPSSISFDQAHATWALQMSENELSGALIEEGMRVDRLSFTGDFSGHLYEEVLLPLFAEFKGDLDAVIVWERGDTVEHIIIEKGTIVLDDCE